MILLSIAILLINFDRIFSLGTPVTPSNGNAIVDAQIIAQSSDQTATLISIFPYRTLDQRIQIANAYKQVNFGIPLFYIQEVPLRGNNFKDLLFAMTTNPTDVYVTYLHEALEGNSAYDHGTLIIEILIIFDAYKANFIQAYNNNPAFQRPLLEAVSDNLHDDYEHFVQELVKRTRESEPNPSILDANEVYTATQNLVQSSHNWEDNRQNLDNILMQRSILFGQQVIKLFTELNGGRDIIAAINDNISDQNLKFGYTSLVKYIANGQFSFLAERIHDSVNERNDNQATNILIITAFSKPSMSEIDEEFRNKYNQCISQYLLSRNYGDSVNQMLAAIVEDAVRNGGIGYM